MAEGQDARSSRSTSRGRRDGSAISDARLKAPTLREEWRSVLLLVLLYAMQGVPLGLSLGSMYVEAEYVDDRIDPQLSLLTLLALFSFPRPFLMQSRMSYTAIGIFSFAAYPYSFKLLWSPIVDSLHVRSFGLRKSWIVPIQLLSGALMVAGGSWAQAQLDAGHAVRVTAFFFVVVLLAATQDIAVDGWALTLLHPRNVGHASTCQTVGVNCGYFLSFTVFLALSDAGFCAKHFARWQADPGQGLLSLQAYLRLWGWVYILVTLALALLKRESPAPSPVAWLRSLASEKTSEKNDAFERNGRRSGAKTPDPEASTVVSSSACSSSIPPIRDAYRQLLRVTALPSVRRLALVLVVCRLGMLPAESIAPLKLLEKGVSKEALAGLVLIEFPIELVSALVAGRAAARGRPYGPWLAGYRMRLVLALLTTLAVALFPAGAAELGDAPWAFAALAALGMATSFCSTLMFTAVGSFYNRISDPSMGGAYLTLLNTIANVGFTVPKFFIFAGVDWLTRRGCVHPWTATPLTIDARGAAASSSAFDALRRSLASWAGLDLLAAAPPPGTACDAAAASAACRAAGGMCAVARDGYYPLAVAAVLVGTAMLPWLRREFPALDALPLAAWHARSGPKSRVK